MVATAGPDLESIIAGRGAGAEAFSKTYGCVTANLDIGGGTTNISVFNCGDLVGQTCIDVGGRLIKYNKAREITYVSRRFNDVGKERNIQVIPGMTVDDNKLALAGDLLADVILDALHQEHYSFTRIATTKNSKKLTLPYPVQYISFSGGVADCFYGKEEDMYRYDDLGPCIAKALREKLPSDPIKNLPVFKIGERAEKALYKCDTHIAREELGWFIGQSQNERIGICIKGKQKASYDDIKNLSQSLIEIDAMCLGADTPMIILCENDMAKALGQVLKRYIKSEKCVLCLDKIKMGSGDYIDIGKPILNGIAVPIVIKTLIFS